MITHTRHIQCLCTSESDGVLGVQRRDLKRVFLFLDACHSGSSLGQQQPSNERLAEALEAGDVAGGPGPRLRHYAAVRSPRRRKTWLRRTDSSVESYLVGVSGDAALAERAVEILNRLDPAQLKPPRPIKIGWW